MTNVSYITIFSLIIFLVAGSWAEAQAPRIGGPRPATGPQPAAAQDKQIPLKIRKFIGVGRQCLVKTPVYQSNIPRSPTPEQDWMQITVSYETGPDWMDDIVFQYHVIVQKMEKGKPVYSWFRRTVTYGDVEKGRNHNSAVYIRPNTLKRYGDVVVAAVEISVDGVVVAVDSAGTLPRLPAEWWKNDEVTKILVSRDGCLLERKETPFAFINTDDFEVSR